VGPLPSSKSAALSCPSLAIYGPGTSSAGQPRPAARRYCPRPRWVAPSCSAAVRFAPSLRDSGLSVTMPGGGTRQGEEVRDGPHGDNRGGVAPTAAPLRPRVGPGLSGSGLYSALGQAVLTPLLAWPLLSYPTSSVAVRFTPLKRCSGASVMRPCLPPVGRAHSLPKAHVQLPRVRRTGFSHRVGASMANRLRPFALPVCALRGASGGATMTYRSPGRFYVVLSYSDQGSSYVHWTRACQACT
jgi:hypothetical protein